MFTKENCLHFLGSEQDYIKIAGVTVPFLVKGSKVYFDLLAAFALMGQLQLAMKNDWKEIDAMLHEQGFDLRVAFRINISGNKWAGHSVEIQKLF